MPGPTQVRSGLPSPKDQRTFVGVAVAVTATPGTDAVADRAPHVTESTHNHTGTRTSTNGAVPGFVRIFGAGRRSRDRAVCASAAGSTPGGSSSHTGVPCEPSPSPTHVHAYQPPSGPFPAGGGRSPSTGAQ
ncbi:hypothetical protein ABZ570_03570 [Micromonospora sp. NPDC007271]|uniref:hypothetical protein n=1 Tax=Micromonospora sp. NPDC007271 TaxID=3154587 RepID=UPI0033EFB2BC